MRSTHASSTVSTRCGDSDENDAEWSLVKQTTSHRPIPARRVNSGSPSGRGSAAPSSGPAASTAPVDSEGNRFSKTTTS